MGYKVGGAILLTKREPLRGRAKEVMPMARFLRDMLVGVLAGIIAQIIYRIFTGK